MPFSGLAGLFSSVFSASQFFPSLLASLAGVWGLPLLVDAGDPVAGLSRVVPLETTDKVVIALSAAIVISVVMQILRRPQVRLYEGYLPSPVFWQPMIRLQRRKRRRIVSEIEALQEEIKALQDIGEERRTDAQNARLDAQNARLDRLTIRCDRRCARSYSATLATALGNVYRASEGYPNNRYDFDGVTLRPRIEPLLPEPAQDAISRGQSAVDLLLTSATLSFAGIMMFAVLEPLTWQTGLWMSGFLIGGYLLYRAAIEAALAHGSAIRAGFDLGRKPFLEAMGFTLPPNLEEERELWRDVTLFLLYGDPVLPPRRATPEVVEVPDRGDSTRYDVLSGLVGAALASTAIGLARRLRR